MAAPSTGGPVRIRLFFDYPPPGSPTCGLCWLLLEPSQVRFVTDLCSLIRDKFGFSRHAKLSLFLDGALLPPTESARLVRDNDSIRVKLEEILGGDNYDETTNGFTNSSKKARKQQRPKPEAEDYTSEDEKHRKRKKSKKARENSSSQEESGANNQGPKKSKKKKKNMMERDTVADNKTDDSTSRSRKLKNQISQGKKEEAGNKDKKQKGRTLEAKNTSQNALLATKNTVAKPSTKKGGTSSETTSSDSDSSTVHTKQMLSDKTKVTSQQTQKSQSGSSAVKPVSACKLPAKPKGGSSLKVAKSNAAQGLSSSSDSDSSSEEEEELQSSNLKCKLPSKKQGTASGPTSKTKPETSSSESDSSESETCTAKSPKTNTVLGQSLRENSGKKLPATTCGLNASPADAGRGRGRIETLWFRGPRVRGCRGMVRGRGRGRGESPSFFNYNGEYQKQQQLNEAATNSSVIIQNPLEIPKKDYSTLPLLAAPPQVGEKIAFKLLELTENYSPHVSDYKEAKIISWNPTNKQIELQILSCSTVAKEPGKFDLVYECPDGTVTIERAVSQEEKITESWSALIEPRLIIDSPNNEGAIENGNP